jgi:hypothetical protein
MATKFPRKPSKPTTTAIIQVTFFGAERFILILLVVQLVNNFQRCSVSLAQISEYKHNSYNHKLCKKLRIKRKLVKSFSFRVSRPLPLFAPDNLTVAIQAHYFFCKALACCLSGERITRVALVSS